MMRHLAQATEIVVSTVVPVHNRLGRLYLFFVAPVHQIVVPAMPARGYDTGPA